jgi:PKHD-type hydroxylase
MRIVEICSKGKEEDANISGSTKWGKRVRKNKVSWQDDEELYSMVREPMNLVNSMAGWNYDITAIEPIQYTIYYCDNNHYSWHTDTLEKDHLTDRGSDNIQNGTVRKISCSVQLDSADSYEGGEFELMTSTESDDGGMGTFSTSSFTVPDFREKGSAIFFPSPTFHRVKPVTKGTRRSLVIWFRGPKWR